MRKPLIFFLLFVLLASLLTAQTGRLQVVVVTGGHDYDSAAFFSMFDSFRGIDYRQVAHPGALQKLRQPDGTFPDVVVFYDMPQEISAAGKETFRMMLMGGTGMVFLHHSLVSYQQWPEYKKIVGGKYHEKNSPDAPRFSTYRHDVDVPVKVLDPVHPVTSGIKDFVLPDEVYGDFEVLRGVHPLLGTSHPESGPVIGWTHEVGEARIVYIQPGHDAQAFVNPNYRKLLNQAMRYAALGNAY